MVKMFIDPALQEAQNHADMADLCKRLGKGKYNSVGKAYRNVAKACSAASGKREAIKNVQTLYKRYSKRNTWLIYQVALLSLKCYRPSPGYAPRTEE